MEILKWEIQSANEIGRLIELVTEYPITVAAFDTEADGLDIKKSKPFVFQFGWYCASKDTIIALAIDLTKILNFHVIIEWWYRVIKYVPRNFAHNVKFDMHMLNNIGLPYPHTNLSDSMFLIRFAHDNVAPRNGGIKLGLKDYCSKYVDASAKNHDVEIQKHRAAIAKQYNSKLKQALGWTLGKIDAFFDDCTNIDSDFPTFQDLSNYYKWRADLPKELQHIKGKVLTEDIPYTMVPRPLIMEYAILDIVWVLRVYIKTWPVIEARGTMPGLLLEEECIYPLWEQECMGFDLDRAYVDGAFFRMRTYIRQRRQDLKDLTGLDITASQNAKILEYLQDNGLPLQSTGAEVLDRVHKDYPNHPTQPIIDCVRDLRTLEKWFTTYLMRFKDADKIYTQINQVGAATLRQSSDFQQFPKKAIKDRNGVELFNPRRCIKVSQGYDLILYLDYSQIELRVQALYTILVGHPDRNLCRAYMPFECTSPELGAYDYTNVDIRKQWNRQDWFLNEDPSIPWTPTDVHGATTMAAFDMTEDHPMFKELRSLGKRVNFAKNYGAQKNKIGSMFPDYDDATIIAIDGGYYKAFPGIKYYQDFCYELARAQAYATNLFGIRYWGVAGHNLINMFIQGGSATFLKRKIVELWKYCKEYAPDIKLIVPIHDEQQFAMKFKDLHHVPKLQAIMEDWDDCYIPIVADAEITTTYWSEKEGFDYETDTNNAGAHEGR